jgi:uncharacterized protein
MAHVTSHRDGNISWYDLSTPDLAVAKAFYGALFGWNFASGGPEVGFYTMCSVGSAPAAGMGTPMPGDTSPTAWTVYFASSDAAATSASIKAAGGQVMVDPMQISDQGTMVVASDPTGAVFGVWQPGRHTGAGVVAEHGAMAWQEVATRDAVAAKAFYGQVFDLRDQPMNDGSNVEYYTLHQKTSANADERDMVAGVMQMNEQWEGIPPHWMPYFTVDNTDQSCELATKHGGTVVYPSFDTQYGRIAGLRDPGGAVFSIIQLPAA